MRISILCSAILLSFVTIALAEVNGSMVYQPGALPPQDSQTHLKVGDKAPEFTLPSTSGKNVSLADFRGQKNIMLSFIPAAWTPVCSDQWPGYCLAQDLFTMNDTLLLGISVDNVPTLYAWTQNMDNLWFPVLSDFWPHGEVAQKYGVLRSTGVSERAMFLIDKEGIIRYIDVHDINKRPDLEDLVKAMESLKE